MRRLLIPLLIAGCATADAGDIFGPGGLISNEAGGGAGSLFVDRDGMMALITVFMADMKEQDAGVPDGECASVNFTEQFTLDEASGNLTGECNSTSMVANGDTVYAIGSINGAGDGIELDGAGDFFVGTDDAAFDAGTTEDVVIEAWARCSDTGCSGHFFSKMDQGTLHGWSMSLSNPNILVGDGTTTCVAGGGGLVDDTWHHLRGTWDRGTTTCRYFIDGIEFTSNTEAGIGDLDNTNVLNIGRISSGGLEWEGRLSNLTACISVGAIESCPSGFDDGLTDDRGSTPTFTRATASTRLDRTLSEGEEVRNGVAAMGAPIDADGTLPEVADEVGFQVFAAETFEVLSNEDLDNVTFWAKQGGIAITADDTDDPYGGNRADLVEDDSAGAESVRSANLTIADDSTTWQGPYWMKCDTPHTTEVQLFASGGAPTIQVDCQETCTTDWRQYSCELTNNSTGNTLLQMIIQPTTGAAAEVGAAHFFRPQLYNRDAQIATDPAVAASAVTVNADVLDYDSISHSDIGIIALWIYPTDLAINPGVFVEWAASDFFLFRQVDGLGRFGLTTAGLADNADVKSDTDVMTANTWQHVCVEWDQAGASIQLFLDGIETDYAATDETWTAAGLYGTTLSIGHRATFQPNAFFAGVVHYDSLTGIDCATIFAAGNPTAWLDTDPDYMLAARERLANGPQPVFAMNPKPRLEGVVR